MDDRQRITRREVVTRTLAAGTTGPLLLADRANAAAAPESDGELLYGVLAVEQLVIAVYERVINAGVLTAEHRLLAERLLSFERLHAGVLAGALQRLGAALPPSLTGASASSLDAILAAKQVPGGVGKISGERQGLLLLVKVEEVAEGAYFKAIGKLSDQRLALRSAEIMASEAQHRVALSAARDPGQVGLAVPVPFVQGRG